MRAVTLLILIMLGLVAAVITISPSPADGAESHRQAIGDVQASLFTIQRHVRLQTTLGQESQRVRNHPARVEPAWFPDGVPLNPWFGRSQPWIEIASPDASERSHPTCIVAVDARDGTFWYQPVTGIVRARVPAGLMDAEAIELYNAVNGTNVTSILP